VKYIILPIHLSVNGIYSESWTFLRFLIHFPFLRDFSSKDERTFREKGLIAIFTGQKSGYSGKKKGRENCRRSGEVERKMLFLSAEGSSGFPFNACKMHRTILEDIAEGAAAPIQNKTISFAKQYGSHFNWKSVVRK
jgi:hypothetical protein